MSAPDEDAFTSANEVGCPVVMTNAIYFDFITKTQTLVKSKVSDQFALNGYASFSTEPDDLCVVLFVPNAEEASTTITVPVILLEHEYFTKKSPWKWFSWFSRVDPLTTDRTEKFLERLSSYKKYAHKESGRPVSVIAEMISKNLDILRENLEANGKPGTDPVKLKANVQFCLQTMFNLSAGLIAKLGEIENLYAEQNKHFTTRPKRTKNVERRAKKLSRTSEAIEYPRAVTTFSLGNSEFVPPEPTEAETRIEEELTEKRLNKYVDPQTAFIKAAAGRTGMKTISWFEDYPTEEQRQRKDMSIFKNCLNSTAFSIIGETDKYVKLYSKGSCTIDKVVQNLNHPAYDETVGLCHKLARKAFLANPGKVGQTTTNTIHDINEMIRIHQMLKRKLTQ
jgi:hypothetical protein